MENGNNNKIFNVVSHFWSFECDFAYHADYCMCLFLDCSVFSLTFQSDHSRLTAAWICKLFSNWKLLLKPNIWFSSCYSIHVTWLTAASKIICVCVLFIYSSLIYPHTFSCLFVHLFSLHSNGAGVYGLYM